MHLISLLSLAWLVLCTTLVLKQNELLFAFFSFATTFLTAFVLSSQSTIAVLTTLLSPGASAKDPVKHKRLSVEDQHSNVRARTLVGVLVLSFSLYLLGCYGNSEIHFKNHASFLRETKYSVEFYTLGIVTGYLAFDLWYERMFCRLFPPPVMSIIENAVTLTIFCVVLARWAQYHESEVISYYDSSQSVTRKSILLWLMYKLSRTLMDLRLIWSVSKVSQVVRTRESLEPVRIMTKTIKSSKSSEDVDETWIIHGEVYDLTDFVHRHPGGKEAILLGRGRDCTALFESYHPFTSQHEVVLQKFKVQKTSKQLGDADDVASPKKLNDIFYQVLKKRVYQCLLEKGIDPETDRCASSGRCLYYLCIFVLLILSMNSHVCGNPVGSFSFAIFGWLIGALGHDAGHFAASRKPMLNDIGVWAMSLLCNPIMWQHQHTYAHHSHTNDSRHDPDLHHFDILLRVHRKCKYRKVHKYQSNTFWVFFAYAFVVFGTCIKIPLGMMQSGFLYGMVQYTDQKRPLRALGMMLHSTLYLYLIIIAPFMAGRPWIVAASCSLIHIVTAGLLFAVFSQINHLNELSQESLIVPKKECVNMDGTSRNECETKEHILAVSSSWAANQVVTSNNFAMESLFWHYLSNGLNMQIEHHLFPGLNHCHLHHITSVVQETCREFGVQYKSYESWVDVMNATLNWMDKLSVIEEEKIETTHA